MQEKVEIKNERFRDAVIPIPMPMPMPIVSSSSVETLIQMKIPLEDESKKLI
jgi:hypothetical protein